jgi:hypothetical protein
MEKEEVETQNALMFPYSAASSSSLLTEPWFVGNVGGMVLGPTKKLCFSNGHSGLRYVNRTH